MNENMFKLLMESIPHPLWIKDLDFRFIYCNDRYKEIYNGKVKNFIGLKNSEVFEKELADKYDSQCREVIETLKEKVEEGYIDGVYRKCTMFPITNEAGEIIAIGGIDSNIEIVKEKDKVIKEQKNLLNLIVDTLPGMVFLKDVEGRYLHINKEYEKFNRKKGITNFIGQTDLEIQQDMKLAKDLIEKDNEVIRSKKNVLMNTTLINDNGEVQYYEIVKKPVINNNEVVGIVGLILEVTEKKKVEEKLRYLSYTDSMTNVYNRAYFDEMAKKYLDEKYLPVGVIMGDANGLKIVNDTFGHEEGDNLLKLITMVLKEACEDKGMVCRIGGDEFVVLLPNSSEKDCEIIIKKIFEKCKNYNHELVDLSIALGVSVTNSLDKSIYDSLKEAEDKVYRQKLLQANSVRSSMMYSLKAGLETKSMETEEHTERILKNAMEVGKKMNLSLSEMDELELVAKLHDIGKIGISEEILLKPGKLTEEEYEIIKTHTEKGYRIVRASNELDSVAKGVLTHHERWDGNGYPLKLKGEKIPLSARIVSVVDSYDVMTHDRVYRKRKKSKEAVEELKKCSGKQFDPKIVDVFVECLHEIRKL